MKIYLVSFLFLLLTGSVNAQIRPADSDDEQASVYALGYCSERIFSGIGTGKSDFLKAVIQIPEETAMNFKGDKLTKVKIGVGNSGFSNTKIFLSYTKEGKPFYSQKATFTGESTWDEIELEEPYEIEGKEFYIGYSLISLNGTMPIMTDDRPTCAGRGWIALANVWHQISEIQNFGNLSIIGMIEGDKLPLYDLSLESVYMDHFVKPGRTFEISSVVRNMATATIKSFDVSYQIGDESPVKETFTDTNIKYGDALDISINAVTYQEGEQAVKVNISNLNGKEDEDVSNNVWEGAINCGKNFVQKKILVEHFATRFIANTITIIDNMQAAISSRRNINRVTHFAGYAPDEEFAIPASEAYTKLYNCGASANGMMIDRANLPYLASAQNTTFFSVDSPVFNGYTWSWTWGEETKMFLGRLMDARLTLEPALVTVDIFKDYDEATHKLKLKVAGRKTGVEGFGELGENLRLNVFMLEDKVRTDQEAEGGVIYYKYDNVIRDVLSDIWGDNILSSEDTFSKEYEYIVPIKWNAKNMKILAFISNYDAKEANNCEVYNSDVLSLTGSASSTSVSSIQANDDIQVYVEKNRMKINGEFTSATVYDLTGKIIKNISNDGTEIILNTGIYIVAIDNTVTRKIIIL